MLSVCNFNPSFAFVCNRVVPSVEEYRIDFDRLDEMEAMDMEQLQPMTPAPPSMTDIDVEMEERPEEQPEELEQLAPVIEEPERLVPVEEQPEQMELADVPRATEEIEEQVSIPPEVEGQVESVAQDVGEEIIEVPDELVPALEAAAEQLPRVVSPAQLPLEVEDVPEVETLRSAVDAPTDQAPDLFAFERETARPGEDLPARYVFQSGTSEKCSCLWNRTRHYMCSNYGATIYSYEPALRAAYEYLSFFSDSKWFI
jgi:hypothetical protein